MKNELWINAGNNFLYFETNKTTLEEAFDEFKNKLASVGCCTDNFGALCDFELRRYTDDNGDYDVIEYQLVMNDGTIKKVKF